MLPWNRPRAHSTFAAEAARLLGEVRTNVESRKGKPIGDDFSGREIWTLGWKQRSFPDGIHKKELVGSSPEFAKCHWCERRLRWKGELTVDHYRPKVKVTRWDGDPPLVTDEPPKQIDVSVGYWWRAFSWDNYSLACDPCNMTFKRNLFPVVEPRLPFQEGVEGQERPLLLDPASNFIVKDHFAWTDDGIMEAVSDQGKSTIITCGLNRKDLLNLRAKVAIDVLRAIQALRFAIEIENKSAQREARAKLATLGHWQSEFTSMVRWFFEKYFRVAWTQVFNSPKDVQEM